MELSLPLIPPFDDNAPWMRTAQRPRSTSPPPTTAQNPHQTHRQRQQRDEEKRQFNARSQLALLAADEAAIAQRKAAVAGFGAQWIRPPGVPKTLQAMTEEQLEREEQAEMERQEAGLRDMQAQQQLAEAQQQAQNNMEVAEAEVGERDLDDDIPDADANVEEEEAERDLDDDIPDADASNVDDTFNPESVIEGSQLQETPEEEAEQYVEMEEAELTGAAQVEEELGLERDLDDSVPEAGSYQHTDTEVEDSDSESELQSSFVPRSTRSSARRQAETAQMAPPQMMMSLQERMRAQVNAADSLTRSPGSLNLSSSILDTSAVAESSPVTQRGNGARGRPRRPRRGRYS